METANALHDIHRRAVVIEKRLTTGKGGVSYEAREAGKVGHGNDRGVVAPTAAESKPIRAMELLLRHIPSADAYAEPLAVVPTSSERYHPSRNRTPTPLPLLFSMSGVLALIGGCWHLDFSS